MYKLVVILFIFFDVINGQCIQINVLTVRFQAINGTLNELLHKEDLATHVYVVGQYNSSVYDTFTQSYGYIIVNDPTNDITSIICTNTYQELNYIPEPITTESILDLTVSTGLYRPHIPSMHYLYQYDGCRMNIIDVLYSTDVIRLTYGITSTTKLNQRCLYACMRISLYGRVHLPQFVYNELRIYKR